MCLRGHAIDPALLHGIFESGERFFHAPVYERVMCVSVDKARRGYSARMTENFASLIGEIHGNDDVEKFRIGPEISLETLCDEDIAYYSTKTARSFFHPNDWTNVPQDLKERSLAYYQAMETLTLRLLSALEVALGVDEGLFTANMRRHTSILTLNYFKQKQQQRETSQPSSSLEENIKISAHTDVSLLTIVAQRSNSSSLAGRLEILPLGSQHWIAAPFETEDGEPLVVVNVGDCLAEWSGGKLCSTLHRVIATDLSESEDTTSISERISVAYFAGPSYDADVAPPGTVDIHATDELHSNAPVRYYTWRQERVKRSMKILASRTTGGIIAPRGPSAASAPATVSSDENYE